MAGECLSYGAFGAYHTAYNTSDFGNTVPGVPKKCTKSWTNFLPDVNSPLMLAKQAEQAQQQERELTYNHELHAGLENFNPECTWVVRRYTPWDERTYAPVPRFKYNTRHDGVAPPKHWIPPRPQTHNDLSEFCRQREKESRQSFQSTPYTRDECWSTLREMNPSTGRPVKTHPPSWGSLASVAPAMTAAPQKRFPMVQSPMTRFVADMHLTNREFNLF